MFDGPSIWYGWSAAASARLEGACDHRLGLSHERLFELLAKLPSRLDDGDDEFWAPKKLLRSSEWREGLEDEEGASGLLAERSSAVEVEDWYLELLWPIRVGFMKLYGTSQNLG